MKPTNNHQPTTTNHQPNPPQSPRGHEQAHDAGQRIRTLMEAASHGTTNYKIYFYISPYLRSRQTYKGIRAAFAPNQIAGMQEDVQLREQDFGGLQGWGAGVGGGGNEWS
jgi:broad specificity phosphatase PhoE